MLRTFDRIDVALKVAALSLAGAALFFPLLDVTFLTQRGTIRSEPVDSLLWLLPLLLGLSLVAPSSPPLQGHVWVLDGVTVSVAVLFSILLIIGFVVTSTINTIGSAVSLPFAAVAVGVDSAIREINAVTVEKLTEPGASKVVIGLGGWLLLASTAACLFQTLRSSRLRRQAADASFH